MAAAYYDDDVRYGTEPAGIHADLQTGIVTTSRGTDTIVRGCGARPDTAHCSGRGSPTCSTAPTSSDCIDGKQGDDAIKGASG